MAKKLPKSINLLDPVIAPGDIWSGLYEWVFTVGKYLLVVVQVIVLGVFFSRFIFDKKNNDLTDEINDQVDALDDPFFKTREIKYRNMQDLLADVALLNEYQITNSERIGGILSSIPTELRLQRLSYNGGDVSLSFLSSDDKAIRQYEKQLNSSPLYKNVSVAFSQSGSTSDVTFSVTFSFVSDGENLLEILDL